MHGWLTHLQHSFHIKFKYLILTKGEHCHDNTKQTFPSLNEKVTNTIRVNIAEMFKYSYTEFVLGRLESG